MLFPRNKLVDTFIRQFEEKNPKSIILFGPKGCGKTTFLKLLENAGILEKGKTEYVKTDIHTHETRIQKPRFIVIDAEISFDFSEIRTFIESKLPETKIIFVTESFSDEDEGIFSFKIPPLSFREYTEGHHHSVNVNELMNEEADSNALVRLRDEYIHLGQNGESLAKGVFSAHAFENKLEEMKADIFPKEYDEFLEFIRTVALNVGGIFKEERIAKLMGISRRKVRKYAHIMTHHHMIRAVGPFFRDETTEMTRHVRFYFCDLSFIQAALGIGYYHGETKPGIIENFVLLELEKKLSESHTIYFYRKKSGAELQFILEENETGKLTPIEISLRNTQAVSQAMKSFDASYSNEVDHYMILDDSFAGQSELSGKPVIILPHFAI